MNKEEMKKFVEQMAQEQAVYEYKLYRQVIKTVVNNILPYDYKTVPGTKIIIPPLF